MLKRLLFIFQGILVGTISFAQNHQCGTELFTDYMRSQNPAEFDRQQAETESKVQKWIQEHAGQRGTQAVLDIPVVFHVLYNNSNQNINDSYLMSQLQVLNEDFNGQNSDINQVPASFTSLIGNAELNFCLATVDPNGNPTTGIIRKQTSKVFKPAQSASDITAPFFNSKGGDNIWDASKYLNIYVVNSGVSTQNGTVLGWARKPGTSLGGFTDASDGVVVNYGVVGSPALDANYSKGRNAVHEIGHWLGLDHIWGDGNPCGCSHSDNVNDTPVQKCPTSGCPSGTKNSCGSMDMTMNYMDYTQDNCRYMLTKGQVSRMQGFLASDNLRKQLSSSTGCGGTPSADAGILLINIPANGTEVACDTDVVPKVRLKNYGATTLSSVDIKYKIDANAPVTLPWTGSLSGGSLKLLDLAAFQVTNSGSHTIEVWTENPNGVADSDASNDKKTNQFSSDCGNSINDIGLGNLIQLNPNPAKENVYLKVELNRKEKVEVRIHNLIGQSILESNYDVSSLNMPIDISGLEHGVYFLTVSHKNKNATKRFVVME